MGESLYLNGREFLEYLYRVSESFGIVDKVQLNTDAREIRFIEKGTEWEVTLVHLVPGMGDLSEKARQQRASSLGKESVYLREEKLRTKIVLSCVGILVEPNVWPSSIPGAESFEGEIVHSARWREGVEFEGKDVVVLGTGCSAAQITPAFAEGAVHAKSVTQLMRTPPYVMPRLEEPFGKERYARYAPMVMSYFPLFGYIYRVFLIILTEVIFYVVSLKKSSYTRNKLAKLTTERTKSMIPQNYHAIMTPMYAIGSKRRIFNSDWLDGMNDPRFTLTQPLTGVQPRSVTLGSSLKQLGSESKEEPSILRTGQIPADGVIQVNGGQLQIPADVIIQANGFESTRFLHPLKVRGRGDKLLGEVWDERGGPQAYMSCAIDGFPNFFMILGPNSSNGHSSLILTSDICINNVLKTIKPVLSGDALYVEPQKEAAMKWTRDLQDDLQETVFVGGGTKSWYRDKRGWNSTIYPRSQFDLVLRAAFPRWSDWKVCHAPSTACRSFRKGARKGAAMIKYGLVSLLVLFLAKWRYDSIKESLRAVRS